MRDTVRFKLNGETVSLAVDPDRFLLWVLRHDLGLTGSKYGCGEGFCGACTVVVDKRAVRSCRLPVKAIEGKEVTTIEGLAKNGDLHALQEAFVQHDALQCGYCIPGIIMNAYGLLLNTPQPSRNEIVRLMEGNLCRCGAYMRIIQAIQTAANEMAGAER